MHTDSFAKFRGLLSQMPNGLPVLIEKLLSALQNYYQIRLSQKGGLDFKIQESESMLRYSCDVLNAVKNTGSTFTLEGLRSGFKRCYPGVAEDALKATPKFVNKLMERIDRLINKSGDKKLYLRFPCRFRENYLEMFFPEISISLFKQDCDGHIYIDGTRFCQTIKESKQLISVLSITKSRKSYMVIAFIIGPAALTKN